MFGERAGDSIWDLLHASLSYCLWFSNLHVGALPPTIPILHTSSWKPIRILPSIGSGWTPIHLWGQYLFIDTYSTAWASPSMDVSCSSCLPSTVPATQEVPDWKMLNRWVNSWRQARSKSSPSTVIRSWKGLLVFISRERDRQSPGPEKGICWADQERGWVRGSEAVDS